MNVEELREFHRETINAGQQSVIMNIMLEIADHKYDSVDLVMSALNTRLGELKAEELMIEDKE